MERNLHWIAPWRSTGIYNIKVCQNSGDPTAHKPKRSRSKTASWQEFSMQKQKRELKETLPISLGFLFKRLMSSWKFYCWNIFIHSLFLHLVKQSKRWTAVLTPFENLDGCPFRWVLQGIMEEKLQELSSAVSQMSPLFLLFSTDSIILIFFLFSSPLQYFVPAKKDASALLLPFKVLCSCCW